MKNLILVLIKSFFVLAWITSHSAQASDINTFNVTDYQNIITQQNNEFIMLFWSIECSPCIKEMRSISTLSKKQRNRFVFVATDGDDFIQEVSNTIKSLNLEKENNWVFSSIATEEIINTIDSSWYGETPRSYYFDKDKKRTRLVNQ